MRSVSLKHLWTTPALLVAAGLVLLGATGRAAAPSRVQSPDDASSCQAIRPSLDALCRCLGASFAPDHDSGFGPVGLCAAFEYGTIDAPRRAGARLGPHPEDRISLRVRLCGCPVGPSPPVEVHSGA